MNEMKVLIKTLSDAAKEYMRITERNTDAFAQLHDALAAVNARADLMSESEAHIEGDLAWTGAEQGYRLDSDDKAEFPPLSQRQILHEVLDRIIDANEKAVAIPADMAFEQYPHADEEGLRKTIAAMQQIQSDVYWRAVNNSLPSYCHPFVEFAALMNEYIKMCEAAAEQGIDFGSRNVHTGLSLPMNHGNAAYIADKLDCLFGSNIRGDQKIAGIFKAALFEPKTAHKRRGP